MYNQITSVCERRLEGRFASVTVRVLRVQKFDCDREAVAPEEEHTLVVPEGRLAQVVAARLFAEAHDVHRPDALAAIAHGLCVGQEVECWEWDPYRDEMQVLHPQLRIAYIDDRGPVCDALLVVGNLPDDGGTVYELDPIMLKPVPA